MLTSGRLSLPPWSLSPAPESPEEVGMLGHAGAHYLAGRGHHLGGLEVVNGHAVRAAEPAEPPAARQSGNTGG
jgi:hypothetical protein